MQYIVPYFFAPTLRFFFVHVPIVLVYSDLRCAKKTAVTAESDCRFCIMLIQRFV